MSQRRGRSAWSYRCNHVLCVEPTTLACLALIASGDGQTSRSDIESSHEAARWLAVIQRTDGSLPVAEGLPSPGWTTPYALLLWSALPGYNDSVSRARTWLLARKGAMHPPGNNAERIAGHDPRLVGWPWVEATHSWLEPTALAILALCRFQLFDHPRVEAGVRLILDRALPDGRLELWQQVRLRHRAAPAAGPHGSRPARAGRPRCSGSRVSRGLAYLREAVAELRAPVSLGWGILGLRAHRALPGEADTWLAQRRRPMHRQARRRHGTGAFAAGVERAGIGPAS